MNVRHQTPLKKYIVSLLKKHHFLSAKQIVDCLHAQGSEVNKTSVYRTLEGFVSDKVVTQQTFQHEMVYELQEDHHDHMVCTRCGKVEKTDCVVLKSVESGTRRGNFQIDHHHLTLYGLCGECSRE